MFPVCMHVWWTECVILNKIIQWTNSGILWKSSPLSIQHCHNTYRVTQTGTYLSRSIYCSSCGYSLGFERYGLGSWHGLWWINVPCENLNCQCMHVTMHNLCHEPVDFLLFSFKRVFFFQIVIAHTSDLFEGFLCSSTDGYKKDLQYDTH